MLTLDKIYHAAFVPQGRSPQDRPHRGTPALKDCQLYLKTENLQVTGSFKGARRLL